MRDLSLILRLSMVRALELSLRDLQNLGHYQHAVLRFQLGHNLNRGAAFRVPRCS